MVHCRPKSDSEDLSLEKRRISVVGLSFFWTNLKEQTVKNNKYYYTVYTLDAETTAEILLPLHLVSLINKNPKDTK